MAASNPTTKTEPIYIDTECGACPWRRRHSLAANGNYVWAYHAAVLLLADHRAERHPEAAA